MSPRPAKKTVRPAQRAAARPRVKKKAAPPRPKKREAPPPVPVTLPAGGFRALRLALALVCAVPVLWGAWKAAQVKVGQHLTLERMEAIVHQGDKPGTLSFVHAIKGDGRGGIFTLSAAGSRWRIQHFDGRLLLSSYIDLDPKKTGDLTDLAVLPDGSLRLAALDGSLLGLDAGLKPFKPAWRAQTGLGQLRSLDVLADGRLLAMDPEEFALVLLDAQGKVLQKIKVPDVTDFRDVAVVPEGVAALYFDGGSVWIRVLDLSGKTLRRFRVDGVAPEDPVRVASSGDVLGVNDEGGIMGVVFYSAQGAFLGNAVAVGGEILKYPGFIGGDPAGGVAYIHYGSGLLKARLPWK